MTELPIIESPNFAVEQTAGSHALTAALDAQSEDVALRFADREQVIVSYRPWPHPCCGDR